jgi:hypothetical protein
MEIFGDANATLKDLTRIWEAEVLEADEPLYPRISSMVESADQAYIKIPIRTKVQFPTLFNGERKPTSTAVNVVQQYNKSTYALTIDIESDLIRESKAYEFSDVVSDAAISSKIFPSWNLVNNLIGANGNAYDAVAFYSATGHYYGKTGSAPATGDLSAGFNLINNTVAKTGQTATALYADLQTAFAQMAAFYDFTGKLLNPRMKWGEKELIIHCPVALAAAFRHVLYGSVLPITVPVTTNGTAAAPASGPSGLRGMEAMCTLIPDGYLDGLSKTTWYLHYVGAPQKPFIYGESYALQAKALGLNSEFETNRNLVRIACKHRFVEGFYRFDRSVRIA